MKGSGENNFGQPANTQQMIEKDILDLRHLLHANPDISNQEYGTAGLIKNFLAPYHPTEIIEGIGGAGLAAVYRFSKKGHNRGI